MSNNKDFKVKNGIKPTIYQETLGTVVSAAEGYYLSGGSYDSVSFSVASQDTAPNDLFFKPDGTAFYIVGASTLGHQYTLSTAWDLSTASYASKSFDFSSQASNDGMGLTFKPDGTKMYMSAESSGTVYQYSLSTAWDISTGSYDSKSLTLQSTAPQGLSFNTDGTKLFTLEDGSDLIYQYSLTTAYDISTASYDSISFAPTEAGQTRGLTFSSDGLSFFVASNGVDAVYKYTVSSAYDISSAVYNSFLDVSSQESSPAGVQFKSDGTKMYVVGSGADTIYQYSTTLATAQLDLSTGSVFDYTPTSNVQVTLINPAASGTASGATLLLGSEDSAGVASTFSTTIYTGTGAAQTITNGIDLSSGGLVWIKPRSVKPNVLQHKTSHYLSSNTTDAEIADTRLVTQFNSNGFNVGIYGGVNSSSDSLVSWTFKKQAKFFDIVTWTGNGTAGRTISHNLGTTVGCVMIKNTSNAENWMVYHIGSGIDGQLNLNTDAAATDDSSQFNDTVPSSTTLTLGGNAEVNANGQTYVAYLFAHDTDATSIIKCGNYTGTGSAGKAVTLGWEPQWLMIKRTDATGYSWEIMDAQRGFVSGNDKVLRANSQGAEITSYDYGAPTSTGFELTTDIAVNASGGNYIYMAIRNLSIPTITYDPNLQWSGGTAPTAPATGEKDVITFNTTDGGTTYKSALALDGAK